MLSRTRTVATNDDDDDQDAEETIELAGSTGNVYRVVVARQPRCDCPHARAGHQCKHVVYVLARVLRARYDLVYQLALLPGELREIFAGAPPLLAGEGGGDERAAEADGRRKPVEGDCPICFMDLVGEGEGEGEGAAGIVWCRAACGQNIHKQCFETWARTKRQSGTGGAWGAKVDVTCPFCRSVWEGDEDMVGKIVKTGKLNAEGYANVADQLGISQVRGECGPLPCGTIVAMTDGFVYSTSARADTGSYSRWWSGHGASWRRSG